MAFESKREMVFCLAQHANYRCRHSGECCTSNWPIPIESDRVDVVRAAAAAGRIEIDEPGAALFEVPDGLPPDAAGVVGRTSRGACVFYDHRGRRCQIHRGLGHDALPSACQHFPRRCLIERDRISVSLSHYCPTVAGAAVSGTAVRGIVAAPSSLVGHLRLEGLDARDVLPPLLRPGMLTDLEGYHAWERVVVDVLEAGDAPEEALWRVREMTRSLAAWKPGARPLAAAVAEAASGIAGNGRGFRQRAVVEAELRDAFQAVRTAVPAAMRPPAPDLPIAAIDARWVETRWSGFHEALGRYLAAHAFGNWCAYLGSGLQTVVRHLEAALAVVRVECGRLCAKHGRPLDEEILAAALRAADLLLVHLADPRQLAAGLDRVQAGP